jgi:hypothetical protein
MTPLHHGVRAEDGRVDPNHTVLATPLCRVAQRTLVATLGCAVGPRQHPGIDHTLCADRQSPENCTAGIFFVRMVSAAGW